MNARHPFRATCAFFSRVIFVFAFTASFSRPLLGAENEILNENAYFRAYYQFDFDHFSPEAMKTDGPKVLSENLMKALERAVKDRLAYKNMDWTKTDWRDHAVIRFICYNGGIQPVPKLEHDANWPAPPADWMKPGFNDAGWPKQRKPFLLGRPELGFNVVNLGVRTCCFRTTFDLPDPAKAGNLKLDLTFHGGARVFVNGVEVGRANLPAGELGEDAFPDDYPQEAYVRKMEELDPAQQKRIHDEFAAKNKPPPMRIFYCPELYGLFDDAPQLEPKPDVRWVISRSNIPVSRTIWERVQKLRDRKLSAVIPVNLLKKGENVLAVEIRASRLHPIAYAGGDAEWLGDANFHFAHALLSRLSVTAGAPGVPSALVRPSGMQVWVEDMHHRLHSTEWAESGRGTGTLRFAAVKNTTFSGQLAVGSDRELSGLKVTAGELKRQAGGSLPAAALQVRFLQPHTLAELSPLSSSRSKNVTDPMVGGEWPLRQHSLTDVSKFTRDQMVKEMAKINFFEHISDAPFKTVPANTCQGIWVYLTVPADAEAGLYKGAITVEAAGAAPVQVPVEAEIFGWRAPEPQNLQTLMALEQSPYGVAKQYGCALWSDEHFKLMEPGFRQLARVGNRWLFVPVLTYSEFGNREDSPIKWIRKKDGRLAFDYAVLDKYLDLALKHWGALQVISFVVMHGNPGNPPEVMLLDEQSGKTETLKVGGAGVTPETKRALWGPFVNALYDHMKARGLEKTMHWGYAWDGEGDPGLKFLLEEFNPAIPWSQGGHAMRVMPQYYKAYSWIYGNQSYSSENYHGWKNPRLEFNNPRGGGSVLCLEGYAPAFGYRLAVDRALVIGTHGVARVGVDYWKSAYFDGARGGEVYLQPGMPVHACLWAGEKGAESSARFEAMVEGVQEGEARIYLEQLLDRKALPEELSRRAEKILFDHNAETLFIPAGIPCRVYLEYGQFGWQERSRKLFAAAAEAAGVVGLDVDKTAAVCDVAPRGVQRLVLKLRNWTGKPRVWKAESAEKWILFDKTSGSANGIEDLAVNLDGNALETGKETAGTITVTDVETSRAWPVKITARVGTVLKISLNNMVCNLTAGKSEPRAFSLMNQSGKEVAWKATASVPWLATEPAGGKMAPGTTLLVKVTAAPPNKEAATLDATLTVAEQGGPASETIKVRAIVIPPYAAPASVPSGEAVPLDKVDKARLKSHKLLTVGNLVTQHWLRNNGEPRFGETSYVGWGVSSKLSEIKDKKYSAALWVFPQHETVYKLEGSGFKGFSAEVGWCVASQNNPELSPDSRVNFEIYVDDKLVTQSGLMTIKDAPRLLVAGNLSAAREIRLVTRLDDFKDNDRVMPFWADPKFYK